MDDAFECSTSITSHVTSELTTIEEKRLEDGQEWTCEGKSIINRDGEDLTVYFIKREVQETPDLVQTLMSTLTCAGQLLEHEWVGGLYLVRVSPYKKVTNVTKGFVDKPIPLEYNWESDMELSSYFLDQKDRQHALHRSYFADKPETKALIADFLQAVLLLKPEDVIQFAIDYFSIFTPDTDEDERLKAEDYEMASGVMNDAMSLVMKHITEKELSELVEELVTSALKRVESKDLLESLEIMIKSAGAISEILNIILNFFMEEADDGVVSGFLAIILRSAIKYEGEEVVVEILNKIVSTVEEQALVLEVVKLSQQENSEDVVLELLEKLLKSTEETVKNEEEELVSDILEEIIQLSVETAERKESKEIADTLISELVEGVMQPEGQAAEEQVEECAVSATDRLRNPELLQEGLHTTKGVHHDWKYTIRKDTDAVPKAIRCTKQGYVKNIKEKLSLYRWCPLELGETEYNSQYIQRDVKSMVEEEKAPALRAICKSRGLGRDEQPAVPPGPNSFAKHLDPYVSTTHLTHTPFTDAQIYGIARNDAITFYTADVSSEISRRREPVFDKLVFGHEEPVKRLSELKCRVPHNKTWDCGTEFPVTIPNASPWETQSAPHMYCTEYCHIGTGWPVTAVIDVGSQTKYHTVTPASRPGVQNKNLVKLPNKSANVRSQPVSKPNNGHCVPCV
ncbi:hypothetical protein C0J52_19694 [Blattella germanica]|nr:hypothetical protein C0J52_19694 [Blattella germanica]